MISSCSLVWKIIPFRFRVEFLYIYIYMLKKHWLLGVPGKGPEKAHITEIARGMTDRAPPLKR